MHQIKNLKGKYYEKNQGGAVKGSNKKPPDCFGLKKNIFFSELFFIFYSCSLDVHTECTVGIKLVCSLYIFLTKLETDVIDK